MLNTSENVPEAFQENEQDSSLWLPLREGTMEEGQETLNPDSLSFLVSEESSSPSSTHRRRLDTNTKLREGLWDHPLSHSWGLFITHFANQVWDMELHIRFGIVLVVVGLIFQGIMMMLVFPWYHPKTIVLFVIFAVSLIYLAPDNVDRQVKALLSLISSPTLLIDFMQNLNEQHLRFFLFLALLSPTFLEMRTVGFLANVIVKSGWNYNILTTLVAFGITFYRKKLHNTTPKDDCTTVTLVLYGSALLTSLYHFHILKIPFLAAPFCVATGTLLLYREESDWLSGAIRQALRFTLRDVLAHLGTNVQEDEMLQLAMLRWIVDYWSYRPSDGSTNDESDAMSAAPSTSPTSASATTPASTPTPTATPNTAPDDEIQWDDLLPMLKATTEQMEQEMPLPSASSGSTTTTSEPTATSSNQSIENLKTMLAQMNIDEHAKPAVDAYKIAVSRFPPSRSMALLVTISRRCPATLLLSWNYTMSSSFFFHYSICCLPLVIAEVYRVLMWAESCNEDHTNEEDKMNQKQPRLEKPIVPLAMDPMWILLSDDIYSPEHPPSLLQVWFNVQNSVSALEAGLSAARCVQTTAVAVDFASNIASLAHLGVQVSQRGWQHGLSVMAEELFQVHTNEHGRARYTFAAVNAVRNGQIVAENVQKLIDDDQVHPAIVPVLNIVTAIAGRGWLWGKTDDPTGTPTPTVKNAAVAEEDNIQREALGTGAESTEDMDARKTQTSEPNETLVRDLNVPPTEDKAGPWQAPEVITSMTDETGLAVAEERIEEVSTLVSNEDTQSPSELEEPAEENLGSRSWDAKIQQEIRVCENTRFEQQRRTPERSQHEGRQNDEHDWTKWVGGGLAVLGAAVVGGIALSHNSQVENSTNQSSVVIEELHDDDGADDEDDDDWIAVPNSYD